MSYQVGISFKIRRGGKTLTSPEMASAIRTQSQLPSKIRFVFLHEIQQIKVPASQNVIAKLFSSVFVITL